MCAFFIRDGKFLDYLVSENSIEPNLKKIEAILIMLEPTCVRDMQRLIGKMVVLNQFMFKSIERCLHLFKKLRKVRNLEWTENCQEAFRNLKQ